MEQGTSGERLKICVGKYPPVATALVTIEEASNSQFIFYDPRFLQQQLEEENRKNSSYWLQLSESRNSNEFH